MPGPYVDLPPLTPAEAQLVVDVLDEACATATGVRFGQLNSLRVAYSEAIANFRGG